MKTSRLLLFIMASLLAMTACKKDSDPEPAPVYTDKVVLNDLVVTGDSVKLSWSRLDNDRFLAYLVIRRTYKSNGEYQYYPYLVEIDDRSVTTYTDRNLPYAPYVEYQVVAGLSTSIPESPELIYSNIRSVERPNIKVFPMTIYDMIPDVSNKRCYIIESDSGKISILDYQNESVTRSVKTNAKIGYCAIGSYNGQNELYVPRNDGWIFIYNSETLEKADQISLAKSVTSLAVNQGTIFACGQDYNYYDNKIWAVDRVTKTILSTNDGNYDQHFAVIPGTQTELIGVPVYSGYYMSWYEYNPAGIKTNEKDVYGLQNPNSVIKIFPDGQQFITSDMAMIYNRNLDLVIQLPHGNYTFSDYAIDPSGAILYAGSNNSRCVISYSIPGYEQVAEYKTKGYPLRVFLDGNTLISLSSTIPTGNIYYGSPINVIIEKIPLGK